MMRPPNSLRVVLAVRRRKEEAEERTLAGINQQIQQAAAAAERLGDELAAFTATRLSEVKLLLSGVHHQNAEAQFRQLQQARAQAIAERELLEDLRLKQMAVYRAARCGREIISELQEQRTAAYRDAVNAREQKRNEDLFLARRVRADGLPCNEAQLYPERRRKVSGRLPMNSRAGQPANRSEADRLSMKVSSTTTANQANALLAGAAVPIGPNGTVSFASLLSFDPVPESPQGRDSRDRGKSSGKHPDEHESRDRSEKTEMPGGRGATGATVSVPPTPLQPVPVWTAGVLIAPISNTSETMPAPVAVGDGGDGVDRSLRASGDGERATLSSQMGAGVSVQAAQAELLPRAVPALTVGEEEAGADARAEADTDPQAVPDTEPMAGVFSSIALNQMVDKYAGAMKAETSLGTQSAPHEPASFREALNPRTGVAADKLPAIGHDAETSEAKPGAPVSSIQAAGNKDVTSTTADAKGVQAAAAGDAGPSGELPGNPKDAGVAMNPSTIPIVNLSSAGNGQQHRDAAGDADGSAQGSDTSQQVPANKEGLSVPQMVSAAETVAAQHPSAGRNDGAVLNPADPSPYKQMLMDHVSASGAARALGNALRSDVHIGLQTEAFGRVTIQATTEGGQLSAQLSLENVRQSVALAAHLPELEQRLSHQSKLDASVSLINDAGRSFGGGSTAGNGQGSDQHDSAERNRRSSGRVLGLDSNQPAGEVSRSPNVGVSSGPRYAESSARMKLDITV